MDEAFDELNASGIIALQNTGMTMSDGLEDVGAALHERPRGTVRGYCFYHGQDLERAVNQEGLWLAFGDLNDQADAKIKIGQEIRKDPRRVWFPGYLRQRRFTESVSLYLTGNAVEAASVRRVMQSPDRAMISAAAEILAEGMVKIEHCVSQLSDDQLWWRPRPDMNSIANLMLHLSGNLRQWIIAGVGARRMSKSPCRFAVRSGVRKMNCWENSSQSSIK